MTYKRKDKVKIHGGKIGIIENVCYEMINSEETDKVYCYEANIDGVSRCVVYPDEIEEKV